VLAYPYRVRRHVLARRGGAPYLPDHGAGWAVHAGTRLLLALAVSRRRRLRLAWPAWLDMLHVSHARLRAVVADGSDEPQE